MYRNIVARIRHKHFAMSANESAYTSPQDMLHLIRKQATHNDDHNVNNYCPRRRSECHWRVGSRTKDLCGATSNSVRRCQVWRAMCLPQHVGDNARPKWMKFAPRTKYVQIRNAPASKRLCGDA